MKENLSIKEVEAWLCSYTGREFCYLTGRGTTAIYAILRAIKHKSNPKIVFPAIIPPSLPNTAILAGYEPVFCDVSLDDFNMDIGSLKETVESNTDISVVMPVHLYGYPVDMTKVRKIADSNDLFVLEDFAQALGAEFEGRKCGSFGDASITSFGHTKILECGGGGAALTDDKKLLEKIKVELKNAPKYSESISQKEGLYRSVYYKLKPIMDLDDELSELYYTIPGIFGKIFVYDLPKGIAEKILLEKEKLEFIINKRRQNAEIYRRILQHPSIIHPNYKNGKSVYWRYSFLLNSNNTQEIVEKARSNGIDVSNWYPPINRWYPSGKIQDQSKFPNAKTIERQIVNLWTLPAITEEKIAYIAETFLKALITS